MPSIIIKIYFNVVIYIIKRYIHAELEESMYMIIIYFYLLKEFIINTEKSI